jgi:hypothetical protein
MDALDFGSQHPISPVFVHVAATICHSAAACQISRTSLISFRSDERTNDVRARKTATDMHAQFDYRGSINAQARCISTF